MKSVRFVVVANVNDNTPAGLLETLASDLAAHVQQTTFAGLATASWSLVQNTGYEKRTLKSDLAEGRY